MIRYSRLPRENNLNKHISQVNFVTIHNHVTPHHILNSLSPSSPLCEGVEHKHMLHVKAIEKNVACVCKPKHIA